MLDDAHSALNTCDLFMTIGTSSVVYPAAGFAATVPPSPYWAPLHLHLLHFVTSRSMASLVLLTDNQLIYCYAIQRLSPWFVLWHAIGASLHTWVGAITLQQTLLSLSVWPTPCWQTFEMFHLLFRLSFHAVPSVYALDLKLHGVRTSRVSTASTLHMPKHMHCACAWLWQRLV